MSGGLMTAAPRYSLNGPYFMVLLSGQCAPSNTSKHVQCISWTNRMVFVVGSASVTVQMPLSCSAIALPQSQTWSQAILKWSLMRIWCTTGPAAGGSRQREEVTGSWVTAWQYLDLYQKTQKRVPVPNGNNSDTGVHNLLDFKEQCG